MQLIYFQFLFLLSTFFMKKFISKIFILCTSGKFDERDYTKFFAILIIKYCIPFKQKIPQLYPSLLISHIIVLYCLILGFDHVIRVILPLHLTIIYIYSIVLNFIFAETFYHLRSCLETPPIRGAYYFW